MGLKEKSIRDYSDKWFIFKSLFTAKGSKTTLLTLGPPPPSPKLNTTPTCHNKSVLTLTLNSFFLSISYITVSLPIVSCCPHPPSTLHTLAPTCTQRGNPARLTPPPTLQPHPLAKSEQQTPEAKYDRGSHSLLWICHYTRVSASARSICSTWPKNKRMMMPCSSWSYSKTPF